MVRHGHAPVSRGLEDLQGLFAFLGAPSPLTDAGWFRRVAKAPYDAGVSEARDAMHAVARRMMWRHARRDVEDELGLPPQSQIVTRLSASGIEAHWYARQRRVCAGAAREALRRVREARAGAKKSAPAAILSGDDEDAETDEDARERRRSRTPAWARAGVGRRLGGGDGSRERDGEEEEGGDEEEGEDDRDEREARSDERGVDEEGDATAATAGSERVVVDDAPSEVDLTSDDARASAADADDLRALTPEESRRVLLPLLRLRQACNHPQAGAHGVRGVARVGGSGGGGGGGARRSRDAASFVGAGGVHHGAIMTMPEIHAVLIEKQRIEAEEAQRLVAFARNASAGVATCLGGAENRRVAVEHYREVLRLDAAGATDGLGLRLDALQRLHALHNLKLALDAVDEEEAAFKIRHSESETPGEKTAVPYRGALPSAPLASPFAGVSRTLRDASLESDAALVRAEYLAKRAGGVGAALTAFRDAVKATNDARLRSGATGPGPAGATWWFAVLDREGARAPNNTNAANTNNAFVDRLARGALGGSWQGRAVAFTDAAGLRFQLESDLARVGLMREAFLERVRTLTERTAKADPADVDAAGRCQVCVSLDGGGDGGGAAFGGVSRANRAGVVRRARRLSPLRRRGGERRVRGRRLREAERRRGVVRKRARARRARRRRRGAVRAELRGDGAQGPRDQVSRRPRYIYAVGHFGCRVVGHFGIRGTRSTRAEIKIGGGGAPRDDGGDPPRVPVRVHASEAPEPRAQGARRARDGDDADQGSRRARGGARGRSRPGARTSPRVRRARLGARGPRPGV